MIQENAEQDVAAPPIPAEDLTRQYTQIEDELREAIERVLPSGRYAEWQRRLEVSVKS